MDITRLLTRRYAAKKFNPDKKRLKPRCAMRPPP